MNAKSRYVFWTFNNPPDIVEGVPPIDFDSWRTKPVYSVYQLERGEEGTLHLQGYSCFRGAI